MSNEPLQGTFHDAITGETVVRDLTPDEIKAIEQAHDEAPASD